MWKTRFLSGCCLAALCFAGAAPREARCAPPANGPVAVPEPVPLAPLPPGAVLATPGPEMMPGANPGPAGGAPGSRPWACVGCTRSSCWCCCNSDVPCPGGPALACCPLPLGAFVHAPMNVQIANGEAAGMILYRCDFCEVNTISAPQLNAHGQRRLCRMVGAMKNCGSGPLLVERSGYAELDMARRNAVLKLLAAAGLPPCDDMVVLGWPNFPMISGQEGVILHLNAIRAMQTQGPAPGAVTPATTGVAAVPVAATPAMPVAQ